MVVLEIIYGRRKEGREGDDGREKEGREEGDEDDDEK